MIRSARRSLGLAALLAACGGEPPPPQAFFSQPAEPVPVMVLRSDSTVTPRGYRVAELHVLLPPTATEDVARASIQNVIDSVARADTLAAAVRVVGFVMGRYHAGTATAELEPAISALWEPTDSVGITGRVRRANFRTTFRILKTFPEDALRTPIR